ncbi:uncharacterized protein LOC135345181 isoform X2 [Halichondria panicea]|uniref:uncharacterized protein LOC135345181 isoform X2 n=1 Tax=Halichondria panicea TaxID=6063 RepID=UPI00312B5AF9
MSGQDSLQANTNSNLMIKVCFPEEMGPVKPDDLDVFLRAVQEIKILNCIQCTLGARVLGAPTTGQVDQPDSAVSPSSNSSAVSVSAAFDPPGYYCRTAAPYHSTEGKDSLKPTVIVELFFSYEVKLPDKEVTVREVTQTLKNTLLRGKDVQVNAVSFLMFKNN